VLTSHIITHLLSDHNPLDEPEPDTEDAKATTAAAEKASYNVSLATWAAWLVEWRRSADETDADVTARRQDIFFQLAQALVTPDHKHEHKHETSPESPESYIGYVCHFHKHANANELTTRHTIQTNYFFWVCCG